VGGFVAAALARAGEDVLVVARESTARHVALHGIEVESVALGSFLARPAAAPRLAEAPDVLLVATKATTLPAALERIEAVPGLVVPLLNGVEHMQLLRERFGPGRVAAGVIRVEADRPAPGHVVQTSPSVRVDLAGPGELVAAALERAGIPVVDGGREPFVLWSKLARLCALACTTSAADAPIGFIRSDPEWRPVLEACVTEVVAVANAEGAGLDPGAPLAELENAHPGLGSSMQRDIAAGREPELDAIAGAVLRAGRRHGIECPTIARLAVEVARRARIAPPHV
jgi:2-dehydropantoate 2-reductase